MKPLVSVVIPTYGRASTLKLVLDGLRKQSYDNFEVIIVFKAAGDETKEIISEYDRSLPIRIVEQKKGFFCDALNLGLKETRGQIITFFDDDAIPNANCLAEHVKAHEISQIVGGVSGSAPSVIISGDGKFIKVENRYSKWLFPWSYPISGMSNWLIFYGKDGLPHYHPDFGTIISSERIVPSLLFMGCNMSVKREAVEGLCFDKDLILGFGNEQIISYQIWRRGYKLLYVPNAKVMHIMQKESLGRFFKTPGRAALRDAEYVLSFFLFKHDKKHFSWVAYILRIVELIISRITSIRRYGLLFRYRIYGLLNGFVIGCAFTISQLFNGNFSIRNALKKLRK